MSAGVLESRSVPSGVKLRKRRSLDVLWSKLPGREARRGNLWDVSLGTFERCGAVRELRKFVFIGSPGGDGWLRIGIFAAIHGDEPTGADALIDLLQELHDNPILALGLELHVCPGYCRTAFTVTRSSPIEGTPRGARAKVSMPEAAPVLLLLKWMLMKMASLCLLA
jgi:hypothetical protein